MFGNFNIGIMGSGNIAGIMAGTINKMKNVRVYAVASRQQVHADVFAGKYGCKKAYGSYADLVADKKVDLIYVATPHSEHYENVKMCLEAGKPVLCEKALTGSSEEAERIFKLAEEKKIYKDTDVQIAHIIKNIRLMKKGVPTAADADRKLFGTDTRIFVFFKNILNDPVLQRVEGDHCNPASVIQKIDHISKGIFQHIQFPVQFDPNRLKGSFGRVSAYGTDFHRNPRFYNMK